MRVGAQQLCCCCCCFVGLLLLLLLLLVIENTLFLGEQGKNKKMDMKKIVSFGSRKTLYLLDPGPIILTSANKIQQKIKSSCSSGTITNTNTTSPLFLLQQQLLQTPSRRSSQLGSLELAYSMHGGAWILSQGELLYTQPPPVCKLIKFVKFAS